MLWQKETKESGGIYIDLLDNVKFVPTNLRLNRKKNNQLSLKSRTEGNVKYHKKDYNGAMAMYNQSICLAENNSEHLSLGYANRSSCFLKMRMYEECLVDIGLAKDAGYPEHMMAKLNNRKSECENSLQSFEQTNFQKPTLSFQSHSKLKCMANVLEIKRNEQYGRFVTVKCDIKIGETLIIEESYIQMMQSDIKNYCSNCGKMNVNFLPCENCADTMYCSQTCASNSFHDSECDMAMHSEDHFDRESSLFILRSVIIGINTFADTKEMMEFVENCLTSQRFEISENTESSKWKYRTFLKLFSNVSNQLLIDLRTTACIIFNAIMESKLAVQFQTKSTQRFLVHLINHHSLILRTNAFKIQKLHTQKLDLITSYFNHSCLPNIVHLDKDNLTIIKAILPIKAGDQVFITYVDRDEYKTEKDRNDHLQNTYGFRCKCKLCSIGISHSTEQENDPNFDFVASNNLRLEQNFNIHLARDLKNSCIKFILKYQDNIVTKQSLFICDTLSEVLHLELSG